MTLPLFRSFTGLLANAGRSKSFIHVPMTARWVLLILLAISVATLIACSQQSETPSSDHEIRIGVIVSLSGDNADLGRATINSAQLVVQETNAAGGLEVGKQRYDVVLLSADDHDEVDAAVNAARKLIYQDDVVVIVGPQMSRNAIPVAKFVEVAHIPMISPRSTNPETTAGKRYVFRSTFLDTFQGSVLARFAFEDLGARRAAVLYDIASPYNRGLAEVFQQVFVAAGGQMVAQESYTTGEQDFKSQLTKIRDRNPDVLFLPNYEYEVPIQAQQARQLGIKATLLGADAWGSLEEDNRHHLNGSFFSDQYAPDSTNEKNQAFIRRYRQAYGQDPNAAAAVTYDSFKLLFQAIQNQGKADPESIRQGLSEIEQYDGVAGIIKYQDTGDPLVSLVILQVKGDRSTVYKRFDP